MDLVHGGDLVRDVVFQRPYPHRRLLVVDRHHHRRYQGLFGGLSVWREVGDDVNGYLGETLAAVHREPDLAGYAFGPALRHRMELEAQVVIEI